MSSLENNENINLPYSDGDNFRYENGQIVYNTDRSSWAKVFLDGLPIDDRMNAVLNGPPLPKIMGSKPKKKKVKTAEQKKEVYIQSLVGRLSASNSTLPTKHRSRGNKRQKQYNATKPHKRGKVQKTHFDSSYEELTCGGR